MTAILAALAGARSAPQASVQLTNQTIIKSSKTTATATYQITNDGTVRNQASVILEAWLTGGSASSYEVRATSVSGLVPVGTLGSWLNCSTNHSWSLSNSVTNTSVSATFLVEIRDVATQTVRASATITLVAVCNEGAQGGGGTGNL